MRVTVLALATTLVLAGCTTTDPVTGETRSNNTATGALIGAIAGGVLGKATGSHHRDRAIVGAAVGALAGGAVGYYMDEQERKLREQTKGTGVGVTRDGNNLVLDIPSGVTFDVDKADIKPSMRKVLDDIASTIDQYEKTMVDVQGHTDSTGSESHNQALSERRAASVRSYLLARGVMAERVHTQGFGELQPVASNDTAEGRARNRRVEIVLTPIVE
ncbi:MAG: OmpA family protein [Corallincola sp.]|nr:OmpA family protein [Corallincola sp.]